jgi:hypothetical protein
MAPTIIFVPGLWEGPTVFDKVTSILQSQGHSTEVTSLLSTGTTSPGNPNMNDDIANIRSTISKVVEAEEEVLLVLHSAGGFLGSSCIEGLTVKAQKEKGLQGGVVKILFLAAGVLPMGATPPLLPFFEFDVSQLSPFSASSGVRLNLTSCRAEQSTVSTLGKISTTGFLKQKKTNG